MNFEPTDKFPGSHEKIDVLRSRADAGLPLWHPLDRKDGTGLTGGMRTSKDGRKGAYRVGKVAFSVRCRKGGKMLSE